MTNTKFHTHDKLTVKITVLYISMLMFSDSKTTISGQKSYMHSNTVVRF